MEIIEATTIIRDDGHLYLDLPTQTSPGKVKISITIQSIPDNEPLPSKYNFSDLVGKLSWSGDAVAVQQNLRDEW